MMVFQMEAMAGNIFLRSFLFMLLINYLILRVVAIVGFLCNFIMFGTASIWGMNHDDPVKISPC